MQEDKITTNIKKIDEALKDCEYMIERFNTDKQYIINPDTNRRMLNDYKVTIYPTKAFQDDQFRSNTHHKNLVEHRVTKEGKTVIKPMRDKYPTRHDFGKFQEDQSEFKKANPGSIH